MIYPPSQHSGIDVAATDTKVLIKYNVCTGDCVDSSSGDTWGFLQRKVCKVKL